ncbi:MAG TPA: hypothetical protein PKH10_01440 [bacterium]|nr:hypothetical protein [bacterium]
MEESKLRAEFALVTKVENGTPTFGYKESILNWRENETELSEAGCGTGERALKLSLWAPAIIADKGETTTDFQSANTPYTKIFCADERTGEIPVVRANREEGLLYSVRVVNTTPSGLKSLHLSRNYHIFNLGGGSLTHRSIHDLSAIAYHPNLTHLNLAGSPQHLVNGGEQGRELSPLIHTRKMKWLDLSDNMLQLEPPVNENDVNCRNYENWTDEPCQRRYGELRELRHMHDLQAFIARDTGIKYFNQRLDTLDRQCACGEHKDFKMPKPLKAENSSAVLKKGLTENIEIQRISRCEGSSDKEIVVVGTIFHAFTAGYCSCGACNFDKMVEEAQKQVEDACQHRIITNPSNIWDVVYTGDQVDDSHPELDITDQYCELLQTEKCGSVPEKVYYKLVINQGDEKPSLEQLEENVVCRVNREGEFPTATYRYGSDDSSYQVLPRCDAFCEDQYSSSPAGTFQVKTVIDGKTANKYRYQASFPRVGVSGEKLIAAYTIEVQYDKKMLERFINDYNDPNGRSPIFDDGILVSDISPRNLKLDLKYFLSGKITPIVDSINLTGGTATDDGRGIVTASGAFEVAQSGPYDSIVFEIDSIKNSKNIFEGPISSWIPAYIKSVSIKDLVFRIGNGTLCEKNEIPISGLLTDTCKCDIYSGECNGVKKFESDLAEQWPALEYLDLSDNPLDNRSIEVAQTLSQYPDLPNGTHGDVVHHCSNRPWYKFIGRYDGIDKFKRLKGLYLENVSDNRNKEDRQTAANTYGCDISNDLLYTVLPRLPRTLAYLDISGVYPLEVEYAPLFPDLKNLRLRELDASHNVISQASFSDDVLDEQYDIEYLDLSGTTYINSFTFLRDMQNLRYLDLSGTAMTEAVADDWDIDHFGRLDYLDISATQVRTLQWLAATPEVQSLFINGTGLYDIESLDYLTKVMELGIAQHCIVKEESGLLVIDEDRIAEHTGQVAFLTGDDSMNAVCNGVQTATAVCGNGIREGSEQCDTEYIACAALNGTQYNIGYAYCLPPEASLFCTWDTSECGWTDDDIVSDEDIVPQPDIDSDLICTNGIVAHSLDGADFCLCNAGYYSLGDRCIKESIHSTGETSAEAAQENSGERENNSTYIEERMDIDTASAPDVDQSSSPDEDIVPLSQMQTEGCSYPTVESCFSEQYQRSRCGILFRGVCRDMMQFCLYVGGRCCIPQKDGNGKLLKICDPKYEGICEFKGSGTGFCTRKGLTGTEPYLGCRFSSASNSDCKAPVSSCRIEQTKYTCKTDEDCGCFDENCTYTCRNKLETGTTPDLSTLERVCTAIACDSGALKPDPDQCAVVSSKDQSKAICVPKDLAEEMELLGDDEGGCYYLEEDDLSINEETGTLQIERICRLPDPVLKFNRDCATFIGCLQNEQATINNYVRFNVPKLPDGADPGQDMKYTDEIDGGNDTQLAYLGSFPTGGRGSEDDFESETGSTEDYSITNCWLYNIDCGSGGEQQFSYYSLPLQSDESTFTVTRRSGRSAASYQSAIAKVINDTVTDNILSYAITESPVGYCNEKLTDCRDYATKKYIDIVNAMRLAAIYERQPIRGIREIFARLPLYAPLAMHDLNSLVNTQYRAGDQMELLLNAPIKRGIRRSRNLFQEVVFYMSKTAETTEENGAHLKNGLFLQYDPNVPMAGGVDVSGFATQITPFFSGETLCQVPDPNENYLSNALCGEKSASHSLSNYRMLFGRPEIDDETLSVYEYKVKTISLLKEQLLDLLLARANIEELWQERKEEALRMNPADESLYGVHDIARKTKPLLAQLSVYRDYFDIQAIADIADPAILREYTKEKLPQEIAIKKARIQRFNELQAKLETDIRMSRYEDSPEAQKLWRDHYPRTRYYLDEMNAEKRASLTQKERAELYPNGETEYLIDTVLRQIDHKIEKILQVAAVGPQMLALPGYNTAVGDFYCFDQNINPAILYLCDSEPSFFLKQAVNLLPPETLEKTYQECLSATNNDANAFGSLSEVTGKYEGGYLRNTANLWVFSPSQGWNSILDDLNNDNDLENVVLRLGNALREYQEWERSYKNKDAVAKVQEIEDYFSFGNTTFAFEEVEGEYLRQEIVRKEDPLLVGKNAFTSCFGSYEDHNKRSLDVLASLGSISTHPACRNISGSVAQPTTWQCFDMWEETYSAYLEEIQAVRDKMAIIEAEYKLKQAEMAARKLKAGGLLNPAAPQETAEGEEEKPRNPFAIPSNLEKWFSDYQQFGVDDLNANFTYIAGAGIKNLILDPNKYNPMPYMTDFHAFLPHLGKALLKHVNKSALDIALQDNPQLVELASLQLGQWMYNNLKNMKKLEQMYTNAMKQVQKFDLVKLKGLVKGKGLGNLIDDEKILEIVADELMKEIITRAYADGSLTAGTNITNPADILDILKTGANFSIEAEMNNMPEISALPNVDESYLQAKAQEALLKLEQQRQQIEAVVRGYETTMQGNVNIIRNEIKSKYGAGKNFYDFIRRLASSGNPAKVLTEDLIGASVLEMFLGQIFSGSLETDITFKIDGESLPCLKEYPDECREDVIDAIKDIPPNELLGKVKITQNGATKTIKEYFSSPSEAVNMVLDYKRLLRQAALSSTLDYTMQTLKVPNESAVMLRQIITTLMQTKSALACAPKFTGGSQPQLKCGSTVMDAGPVMSLPAGAIQLNLMDAVKGIFESASVRGTAVDIQASPETSVMALTAGYIDAAFLDSIPILKNRADPDVMKLRFVLSDFIAKIAYISWRSERLITRILDAVNGEYTPLKVYGEEGSSISPIETPALRTEFDVFGTTNTFAETLKTFAREQGKKLLGKLIEKAEECATSSEKGCDINDFLGTLDMFGKYGNSSQLGTEIKLPDLGEIMNQLMVLMDSYQDDQGMKDFFKESMADVLDIYRLSSGMVTPQQLRSILLSGWSLDTGGVSLEQRPTEDCLPPSDCTGKVTSVTDSLAVSSLSVPAQAELREELTDLPFTDTLNILLTALGRAGISSLANSQAPDLSKAWGNIGNFDQVILPPVYKTEFDTNLLDPNQLEFNLSVISEDAGFRAVVSFPSFNFGHLKGSVEGSLQQLLAPALAQLDAYQADAANLIEITDPEYWKGLLDKMVVPGFDDDHLSALNDLKVKIDALKTATDGSAITEIKYGDDGIAQIFNQKFQIATGTEGPLNEVVLPMETVQKVSYAIPQILIDPVFYQRVIKRIANETAIIAAFKEVFNGAASDPKSWLMATIGGGDAEGMPMPALISEGLSSLNVATLKQLFPENPDSSFFISVLADAVIMRAEEVFMKELFKLPFAEVAMHTSAGLHLFGFDADLFEATFYVTTRLDRDKYGRIIDLESVHPKARDKFIRRYDKKVEKFKPYTKYYFFAAMTSFDDLAETAVEAGKKALKEAADAAIKTAVGMAQAEIDKQLEAISTDVKDADKFESKIAKDPKLEDFKFAELEESDTINFQIGPVPAYLTYGFTFDAGIRYGIDYNYGWFRGLTVGASAGPYIVAGAFLEVGAGFDYTFLSFQIGIGGHIDIFDFYAPLKVQGMLKPELDLSGVGVKFYLSTSLIPELKLLAGYIYVRAKGSIGIEPIALKFNVTRTIFEWDPLIDMKFGNLIPLKPLKIDLFSIGEGVKLLGKEM